MKCVCQEKILTDLRKIDCKDGTNCKPHVFIVVCTIICELQYLCKVYTGDHNTHHSTNVLMIILCRFHVNSSNVTKHTIYIYIFFFRSLHSVSTVLIKCPGTQGSIVYINLII